VSSKLILAVAILLSGSLFGCSTARQHSVETSSTKLDLPYQKINGFPYGTKPVWLGSRGLFYWFISTDLKLIHYEPCCGNYVVDPLRQTKSELIFKIVKSNGIALDLRNGKQLASSDVIGKKYRAKLEGDHIVSVSEIE
jgi:hypothetical protein